MNIDRWVYKSFFWVTGLSYLLVALFTFFATDMDHLWPGKFPWTVGYVLVGLGVFTTGFFVRKSIRGPKMWLKKFGLYATPVLLVARGLSNLFANGVNGVVSTIFLFWAAFVVIWAAFLLRRLPADVDEWELLEDEYQDLRHEVDSLR